MLLNPLNGMALALCNAFCCLLGGIEPKPLIIKEIEMKIFLAFCRLPCDLNPLMNPAPKSKTALLTGETTKGGYYALTNRNTQTYIIPFSSAPVSSASSPHWGYLISVIVNQ